MADLVDPRSGSSEFDGIESRDPGSVPQRRQDSEASKKRDNPEESRQVDPRKEYREFDGIRSRD